MRELRHGASSWLGGLLLFGGLLLAVEPHVALNQCVGGHRRHKAELTAKHGGSNDSRQLPRIVPGGAGLASCDSQHGQHGLLGLQPHATPDSSDLNARHADRYEQVTLRCFLHLSDALRAFNNLRWILTSCKENSGNQISGMGIETTN